MYDFVLKSRIWDYFMIDQEEKLAVCNNCIEHVSQGVASAKNYSHYLPPCWFYQEFTMQGSILGSL